VLVARDVDLGLTGPPMSIDLDVITGSLVELLSGLAASVGRFGYSW
jgi:hypothetical protein